MAKNNDRREIRSAMMIGGAAALALAAAGCFYIPQTRTGPTQTETLSVPAGAAKSVSVHLKIGAGELQISGGAQKLMTGTISYNVPEWKPDLSYSVDGTRGMLMVMQPEGTHSTGGNIQYDWNLQFNNEMPLDVAVEMGAGKSDLNLSGLNLENFSMEAGAGEATVDMSGPWKKNLSASFEGGVGEIHLKLPREVGVHVTIDGGLGSIDAPDFKRHGDAYVNDAYGKSPVTLEIHVEGGIGTVHLDLVGARGVA